jgi:hypothetical protein
MAPQLVVVQGLRDTRGTLERWNPRPLATIGPWFALAAAIAAALLAAVVVVAQLSTPDPKPLIQPGLTREPLLSDVGPILFRNALVLTLHAMACVAGFIAGSSLPLQADQHSGLWRRVHEKAGPAAIAFVVGATAFSLCTQAYVLGGGAAALSLQLHVSELTLMLTLLPHALLELVALFLPLAAWMIASRRGDWHELLAATFATTLVATPALVLAAMLEVFVWPDLLRAVSPVA